MDEAVIKYYRRLLREDFPNAGTIERPSIFMEAVGEKLINCGNTGNYMQLYLGLDGERVVEIKYRCACEPVANVAVEVLCALVKGKTLDEVLALDAEPFYEWVGSREDGLRKKVEGLLALLHEGIGSHMGGQNKPPQGEDTQTGQTLSWDGPLST